MGSRGSHPLNAHRAHHDVLVLGYHAISDDWDSDLAVNTAAFERQMTVLLRQGYHGSTFAHAVTEPAGRNLLVVTFDDAYRSVISLALPIMAKLGLPGTVFVPTDFASGSQRASWSGVDIHLGTPHAHELDVMSWDELGKLVDLGWEVGSHTCSHPMLTRLDDDALMHELCTSRRECESQLHGPCMSIAYPYGDTNSRIVAAAADAGYIAGAGLPHARRLNQRSPLNWPRIGIFYRDGALRFKAKASRISRRLRTTIS